MLPAWWAGPFLGNTRVHGGKNPDQRAEQNQTTCGELLRCTEGLREALRRPETQRGRSPNGVPDGEGVGQWVVRFFLRARPWLSRKLSPFISRIWTWWVRRSSRAPLRRSEPKVSVHSSKGRLEVSTEARS